MRTSTNPLTLYIHTPWCIKKCPYCDFNSHALKNELPEEAYIATLIEDFEASLPLIQNRPLTAIFIGGGTPSLLSPQSYQTLFTTINQHCPLDSTTEITLEANPGTFEQEKFSRFREIGINRLSLGVQSLQDDKLQALGRIHGADEAIQAVKRAQAVGFENLNCDLMFGLPGQTIADALGDLGKVIVLKPAHISWYQLTLEPNTAFAHQPPKLPNDEKIWVMQQQGQKLLTQAGFKQYEISAYAKNDQVCQHNLNYWLFGDYLGIGAGAHSKITDQQHQTITRTWKVKHPRAYLDPNKSFIAGSKVLTADELPLEFMLNTLRLYQPISFEHFEKHTHLSHEVLNKTLRKAQDQGLLTFDQDKLQTTALGKRFLNDLLLLFN